MPPIKEVWSNNLEYEMRVIRELVEKYPVIAMVRHWFGSVRMDYLRLDRRIPSFLASWRVLLALSRLHPTTTTRPCDVMLTYSNRFKSALRLRTRMGTTRRIYRLGNSTFTSAYSA